MSDISIAQLVAYCLGECGPDEAKRIEAANVGDRIERCRRMLADLSAYRDHASDLEVSAGAIDRLAALWPTPGPQASTGDGLGAMLSGLARVVVGLVHDSDRAAGLAAGFRGAGEARSLVFANRGVEIELRVSTKPTLSGGMKDARVGIVGTVSAPSVPIEVVARGGAGGEVAVSVDPDGFFEMELPQGRYAWTVRCEEQLILIEEVELGA